MHVDFIYDEKTDTTTGYLWQRQRYLSNTKIPGKLDSKQEKRYTKIIKEDYDSSRK